MFLRPLKSYKESKKHSAATLEACFAALIEHCIFACLTESKQKEEEQLMNQTFVVGFLLYTLLFLSMSLTFNCQIFLEEVYLML